MLYEVITKTITPADQPALRLHVQMVMNEAATHSRYMAAIQTRDGTTKMVEFVFNLIQYNGKPALLGRGRDITVRIRTEQALLHANKKLHLLSSITRHDIKNHLTSLQTAMEVIAECKTGENIDVITSYSIHYTKLYDYLHEEVPALS